LAVEPASVWVWRIARVVASSSAFRASPFEASVSSDSVLNVIADLDMKTASIEVSAIDDIH
jgi:hypothetical protein